MNGTRLRLQTVMPAAERVAVSANGTLLPPLAQCPYDVIPNPVARFGERCEGSAFRFRTRRDERAYYVYTLASRSRTCVPGVTNNLQHRMIEHLERRVPGFTSQHRILRQVHFESLFGKLPRWYNPLAATMSRHEKRAAKQARRAGTKGA